METDYKFWTEKNSTVLKYGEIDVVLEGKAAYEDDEYYATAVDKYGQQYGVVWELTDSYRNGCTLLALETLVESAKGIEKEFAQKELYEFIESISVDGEIDVDAPDDESHACDWDDYNIERI